MKLLLPLQCLERRYVHRIILGKLQPVHPLDQSIQESRVLPESRLELVGLFRSELGAVHLANVAGEAPARRDERRGFVERKTIVQQAPDRYPDRMPEETR